MRQFTKYPSNYVKASTDAYTDADLEQMWLDLTDVPFDEAEDGRLLLAEDWEQFPAGTDREDIWYFFDKNYSKGVAYLLNDLGTDVEASTSIKADTNPKVQQALGREVDRLRRSDLFKGKVPKNIQDRTIENMDVYNLGLSDAFEEACHELAPKGSELYNAWYYSDFRKFIPSAYREEYLDFDKYPLKY